MSGEVVKRGRGRPKGRKDSKPRMPSSPSRVRPVDNDGENVAEDLDWQQFLRPVSVTFLVNVLGMARPNIQKKLVNLPPIGYARNNSPLYDFRQALAYLVTPATQTKQKRDWDDELKRVKFLQIAGRLWRTEDVQDVFSRVFLLIKDRMTLWVEALAENTVLSDDQRSRVIEMVDALQSEIHAELVKMPKARRTPSFVAHFEREEGAPEPSTEVAFEDDEDLVG